MRGGPFQAVLQRLTPRHYCLDLESGKRYIFFINRRRPGNAGPGLWQITALGQCLFDRRKAPVVRGTIGRFPSAVFLQQAKSLCQWKTGGLGVRALCIQSDQPP